MSKEDGGVAESEKRFGNIVLEASENVEVIKSFEKSLTDKKVELLEAENAGLKQENNELKLKLAQQTEDEADIYFYLHKKLDDNYAVIAELEKNLHEMKQQKSMADDIFNSQLELQKQENDDEIRKLKATVLNAENELENLHSFRNKKQKIEAKIDGLEKSLDEAKSSNFKKISEIERRNVQEKERLKKDMLVKIKETKQNLLAMTEDQLHTTTKRTIMENEQMIKELQYQSKETERLLVRHKDLENQVIDLRRRLEISEQTEQELAKKTHFYQKLIKKMNDKVKRDEINNSIVSSNHEKKGEQINQANEEMVKILSNKFEKLEKNFLEVSDELKESRTLLDKCYQEKYKNMSLQDETVQFLLIAMEDIAHQIGEKNITEKNDDKSIADWCLETVIPVHLDELPPVKKHQALSLLFGKLRAFQTKAQINQPGDENGREILEKQLGISLPPISPEKIDPLKRNSEQSQSWKSKQPKTCEKSKSGNNLISEEISKPKLSQKSSTATSRFSWKSQSNRSSKQSVKKNIQTSMRRSFT